MNSLPSHMMTTLLLLSLLIQLWVPLKFPQLHRKQFKSELEAFSYRSTEWFGVWYVRSLSVCEEFSHTTPDFWTSVGLSYRDLELLKSECKNREEFVRILKDRGINSKPLQEKLTKHFKCDRLRENRAQRGVLNIEKRSIDFLKMYCFKHMEENG